MADSITPWLANAALSYQTKYDSLMPDSTEPYEVGEHLQLLKVRRVAGPLGSSRAAAVDAPA